MDEMLKRIKEMCQEIGCGIIKHEGNTIIYGATEYEKFGPAFIHLSFAEDIKPYLVEAIWSNKHEGSYSVIEHIMRRRGNKRL